MTNNTNISTKIFVLCENSILSDDKKWSLINIFDQLHTLENPPIEVSFTLFLNIEANEGKYDLALLGKTPGSKDIEKIFETPFTVSQTRLHIVNMKINMRIAEYGIYKFIAIVNGEEIGISSMNVVKEPRPVEE